MELEFMELIIALLSLVSYNSILNSGALYYAMSHVILYTFSGFLMIK